MIKKMIGAVAAISLLLTSSLTVAQQQQDPYKLVQDVASITFERIKKEQPQIAENSDVLRDIMEQELLPYVDYRFSAHMVLGKHFKKATKAEQVEFVKVFREYLITTYAVAMGYYNGQTVEFQPAASFAGKKTVTVRALVKEEGRPDIKIAFKVRKNKKTNRWKAYDMVAEGISVLSSKRSEFESILRQQGIQVVIDLMKDKIAKPITVEKDSKES